MEFYADFTPSGRVKTLIRVTSEGTERFDAGEWKPSKRSVSKLTPLSAREGQLAMKRALR